MKYKAVKGSHISDDQAEIIGQHICTIIEKNNGHITPLYILDDAKSINSPLHEYFDWDNQIAADKWRIEQAHYLLRSVNIVYETNDEEIETRAFVNITIIGNDHKDRFYTDIYRVLSDKELIHQTLEKALKELKDWQDRYEKYQELFLIFEAIEKTIILNVASPVAARCGDSRSGVTGHGELVINRND